MDGHGTEAGGAGNGSWIDEGIRGSLVAEWKQEAARAMLGKMSMCGRCVLCVCGVRNPSLQCVPEPELRASLIGVIGVDEVHAWGEGADGCSMCLGILQVMDDEVCTPSLDSDEGSSCLNHANHRSMQRAQSSP